VTQTIALGRGPIEYEEFAPAGGKETLAPLVFLHEGLGSVALWRGFPRAVADATGRRTLVFSRHGYGGSAVVAEPRRVSYMHHEATDVLPQILDRLGYDAPVLIGHSDGASIALIHAGTGAGAPTGLVLLAPHVVVEDVSVASIAAAREVFLTTDMAERMGRYHTDPAATFWGWNDIWLAPAFRDWDIRDVLPAVRCPSLLMQGLDDEYGTLRQLDLIEEGVRGDVTRVELADCRHAPHLDQPEATLAAVTAFLDALGR
jgi:pimeloyl-ACP methyl ester carboxylesterase